MMARCKRENSFSFPVEIDKSSRENLTNQFVNGVKRAVQQGLLKEGDRIPSREELAHRYGCSLRVPREAFRQLKRDGYIVTHPRLGSTVCMPKGEKTWKGVVLLVRYDVDETSYYSVNLEVGLRQRLAPAGFLLLTVQIRQLTSNSFDFAAVQRFLQFGISLALVLCPNPYVRRWFERRHVPFMSADGSDAISGCCGSLGRWDYEQALSEFASHFRREGVKTVLHVGFCRGSGIYELLKRKLVEVEVSQLVIPPEKNLPRIDGVVNAAFSVFSTRLAQSRSWLPDLLSFDDDYVARGALMALMDAGIRVPEDVRVVTLLNRGQECFFSKRLSGFLVDGRQLGRAYSEAVVTYFRNNRFAIAPSQVVVYQEGETFRINKDIGNVLITK